MRIDPKKSACKSLYHDHTGRILRPQLEFGLSVDISRSMIPIPRHAYLTGKDQPYDKLQRALRGEVDEDAWQSLYCPVSRPFLPLASGKIAVKVINHY